MSLGRALSMEERRPCTKSEDAQDERGRARLSYQQAEALPRAAFSPVAYHGGFGCQPGSATR
jgi:hypothetical protein